MDKCVRFVIMRWEKKLHRGCKVDCVEFIIHHTSHVYQHEYITRVHPHSQKAFFVLCGVALPGNVQIHILSCFAARIGKKTFRSDTIRAAAAQVTHCTCEQNIRPARSCEAVSLFLAALAAALLLIVIDSHEGGASSVATSPHSAL